MVVLPRSPRRAEQVAPGVVEALGRFPSSDRGQRAGVGLDAAAHWSQSSNLRARLMVMARDCGLWILTLRLRGGWSPAVKSCTFYASDR